MNCLPRMNVLSPFVPVWKAGLHIREDLKASMRVILRVSGQGIFSHLFRSGNIIELFQWMFLPPLRIWVAGLQSLIARSLFGNTAGFLA